MLQLVQLAKIEYPYVTSPCYYDQIFMAQWWSYERDSTVVRKLAAESFRPERKRMSMSGQVQILSIIGNMFFVSILSSGHLVRVVKALYTPLEYNC